MSRLRVVLLGWFGLFLIAAGRAVEGLPPPAASPGVGVKDETAARVSRLIALLGSSTFAERERATKELETLGVPALPALREAARSDDPETRRRASDLIGRIENSLDALVIAYREYGLPLPPPGAPLVLFADADPNTTQSPTLAFLIRPPGKRNFPEFLTGLRKDLSFAGDGLKITPIKPLILSTKELVALTRQATFFGGEDALALAIQCQARGWRDLARALLDRAGEEYSEGTPGSGFSMKPGISGGLNWVSRMQTGPRSASACAPSGPRGRSWTPRRPAKCSPRWRRPWCRARPNPGASRR